MKQVIVECAPDGTVKIEAVGFQGNACEKATAEIERALGQVKSRSKKPEYFQANKRTQTTGN